METSKNITKRLLAVIISLAMVFSLVQGGIFTASAAKSGDFFYRVLADGTAEITSYTGSTAELTIPATIDEYTVTSVGNNAFLSNNVITSVTIGNSVTIIGDYAFNNCTALASVEIPNTVKSIGEGAFGGCVSLPSIEIPASVESIGEYAFDWCSAMTSITVAEDNANYLSENGILFNKDKTKIIQYPLGSATTSYTIPDSVTNIASGAFENGDALTSVVIPDSVERIGDYAFYDCTSLADITIGESVTYIGDSVFQDTAFYLDENNWENKILCIDDYLVSSKRDIEGNYQIKDGIKLIACYGFWECELLTSIEIPKSVKFIGDYAFMSCYALTSITVAEDNADYSSENGVLFDKSKTELIKYPESKTETSYIIPNTVKKIDSYAMCGLPLTSVEIPNSVESIGNGAFETSLLTSIEIPNSVKTIGDYAFNSCIDATSLTIGNSVESIGEGAFQSCNGLTSVEIPNSVKSIGDWAFYYCENLESATIGNSVENIGKYAFYSCHKLTSVEIPKSVKFIGEKAFYLCTTLTTVNYSGTKEQWDRITIADGNNYLTGATINYGASSSDCEHTNTVTDSAVPPTCDETGLTEGSHCNDCGKTIVAQEVVSAKGHDTHLVQEKAPTCTVNGNNAYYICNECNEWFSDAEGTRKITDKNTVVKPALDHSFTDYKSNNDATCTEDGTKTAVCDRDNCNATDTKADENTAKGHTEVTDKAVAPTCEKTGLTAGSHCKDCGAKIKAQTVVKAKGHSTTTKNKKSATYFAKGYTGDTYCNTCKKVVKNGKSIAKKVLKTPKVNVTKGKRQIKVKYTKVSGATGFEVQYKVGKKTVTKSFNTKKSVTRAIKKLKKGSYKVKVRAFVKSGKKKACSKWTKTYKVNVK